MNFPHKLKFKGQIATTTGRFAELLSWVASKPKGKTLNNPYNQDFFDQAVYRPGNDFAGGTFEELIQPHTDFSYYNDALAKMSNDKVWKNSSTKLEQIVERKRKRSEYDGEYDYDRRYDIEPFQRRTSKPQVARIVKLNLHNNYAAGVSHETISRFAGFVVAIAHLLERNGVLVSINTMYETDRVFGAHSIHSTINVKEPQEYTPVGQLLKSMSPQFYRRAYFGLMIYVSDKCNGLAAPGLGQVRPVPKVWDVINGEVHIYSPPQPNVQEQIIQKLIEIVGK